MYFKLTKIGIFRIFAVIMTDFEILPGEQLAIIGPNASGKTKIAESLAADKNARYLSFKDSYGFSADQGYYMQLRWNTGMIEDYDPTVGATLNQAADESNDAEQAHRRLDELVKLFKLEDSLGKFLVSLSSGELRKYLLTKALMSGPEILIVDNPYIGLDPASRALLTDLFGTLTAEGKLTVIVVLAREDELPSFITHVALVENGKISRKMTADEFRESIMPPAVLRLDKVSIRYGDRVILHELDWTVREGEHWAITGENGCGKTTLLSLITADNPQGYACDIELFGRKRGSGETIWDIKKNIGYVSPEMHRAYSANVPALDIVASGLFDTVGLHRKPSEQQRASCLEWMERFGIAHLAERSFMKISSGEQRLCLLCRAFVKDPKLYILDEPLHGLDTLQRKKMKALLGDLCGQPGKTLIMVTHYPEEYPSCIDHSLTLRRQ